MSLILVTTPFYKALSQGEIWCWSLWGCKGLKPGPHLRRKRLGLPRKFTTIEALVIQSKFGRHDVVIVGIYRPPKPTGNNYYVTLERDLNDLTSWASVQKSLLVITGDLNLDRLRPLPREGKILCDLEETHGLTCVITRPTRITSNSETLIDVILTNKPELFKDCGVWDAGISDHALVYGLMKERNAFYKSKVLTVRSYKELNEKELQMDLDMAPWHVSSIFDSTDDQHFYWHLKKMRVRAVDVLYMTLEWKKAMRRKRRYAKRYARTTEENRELMKTWRNTATRLRRRSIKEYWSKKADDLKTNPKIFYGVFKPFLHSKSKKCENALINLDNEGVIERDQRKIAEHFAEYLRSKLCKKKNVITSVLDKKCKMTSFLANETFIHLRQHKNRTSVNLQIIHNVHNFSLSQFFNTVHIKLFYVNVKYNCMLQDRLENKTLISGAIPVILWRP